MDEGHCGRLRRSDGVYDKTAGEALHPVRFNRAPVGTAASCQVVAFSSYDRGIRSSTDSVLH